MPQNGPDNLPRHVAWALPVQVVWALLAGLWNLAGYIAWKRQARTR